jgi:hypothetical protein
MPATHALAEKVCFPDTPPPFVQNHISGTEVDPRKKFRKFGKYASSFFGGFCV